MPCRFLYSCKTHNLIPVIQSHFQSCGPWHLVITTCIPGPNHVMLLLISCLCKHFTMQLHNTCVTPTDTICSTHVPQLMVDTDRVDPTRQIDLTQICNSGLFRLEPLRRQFGFQLTDEVSLRPGWSSGCFTAGFCGCMCDVYGGADGVVLAHVGDQCGQIHFQLRGSV